MSDYLHGAYGQIQAVGAKVSQESDSIIVYVGTAPVHTVIGGSANVGKPVLVKNIAEARKLFGYSEEWDKYTLCEAMAVHLEQKGVGPIVLINVLDPAKHKAAQQVTANLTPANGKIVIASAGGVIQDTLVVGTGENVKTLGKDYTLAYDFQKEIITLSEVTAGSLGTAELAVKYSAIDASAVTQADVIGASDGAGLNTGLYAVKNVYQATGAIPAYLAAPGFSSVPAVHKIMAELSHKVNGHWDCYLFADLPLTSGETQITMATAATFKNQNGYTLENETVYFPMAEGTDGKHYHLSVLAAANFQELLLASGGIPYRSASNTACRIIQNLYMGEANSNRLFDDELINEALNKNGIASAAFVGGRWAIWGAHSAAYDQTNGDTLNVAETARMMLYYISNDFQNRRTFDVDRPMTANDLNMIVSEEQGRLDALVKIGALTLGRVNLDATSLTDSDVMSADFTFSFEVSTTPLAKSLTAIVNWTEEGITTYFESFAD